MPIDLSHCVISPCTPKVAMNANASGMPAKFDATPEKVRMDERIQKATGQA